MKQLIWAALAAICLTATSAHAESAVPAIHPQPLRSRAPVALLIDLESDTLLLAQDAERQIPPASMTKIMTSYVALDLIAKGRLDPVAVTVISTQTAGRWSGRGSTMNLRAGDTPTIADLLDGTITLSGNDAAIALAEAIDGSEASFVARMNAMAQRLGMESSRFGTCNGWPDGGQTMVTARDLAILSRALLRDHPQLYARYYGNPSFSWNGITQPNRNPLLGKLEGADGIKTGHTREAGYGFVGSAQRNGRRLLMVVAGLQSMAGREAAALTLMNWGYAGWENRRLAVAGQIVGHADVQLGNAQSVPLQAKQDIIITVPRGTKPTVTSTIRYSGPLRAPISAGAEVAELVIAVEGQGERIVPLFATASVAHGDMFDRIGFGLRGLMPDRLAI